MFKQKFNQISKWMVYIFILFLPFVVFYWQVPFLSDRTIGNDYIDCSIHEQMELQYSLKRGSFPLYVPGFAGGQTSAALTNGQVYHPISHLSSILPGYWQGKALHWNTLWRLLFLGLAHLVLYMLLCRLRLSGIFSFIIAFITVYNFRMMDMFRYAAALENYTGYLFLCAALAFYYIKPTRFIGPFCIIVSTYLLICGGHPQMMYLGLIGAGIAAVAIPFILGKVSGNLRADRPRLIKYFTAIGVCLTTGILLASAYTIPFYFDFLRTNALRIGHDYHWSLVFSDSVGGTLNSLFAPLHSDIHGAFGSSPLVILIAFVPLLYLVREKVPAAVIALWTVLVVIFLCILGEATPVHYLFWKYIPLAQTFRVPGRIALLFPFLFLLMLAWLFRGTGGTDNTNQRDEKVKSPLLALPALPLFLMYNWVLVKYLPKPGPFTPTRINPHPQWVDSLILWLGFFTLILVALHAFRLKQITKRWSWRTVMGILLTITVVAQVTVEIRFGIWMVKHPRGWTLDKMDKQKKRELTSYTTACYGLESSIVVNQMRQSILEPRLAKFYRKYKRVSNQEEACRFLNQENVTNTLIIEGAERALAEVTSKRNDEDVIILEESSYNRVVFSADARAPGFFTLCFPYSGKWTAEIDGKRTRLYRANAYMHAVYVRAGQYQIEFRYWSKAAFVGMLISCSTFLFMGIYFAFFVPGKKRKQQISVLIISVLVSVGVFWGWYRSLYKGDNLETRYTWTSKDFPPVNNLAYAKKTKMNPCGHSFHASRGVDGRTRKPSFKTPPNKKGWWQVDLGAPKQIGKIVIYDGKFSGKKHLPFKILGSIDGKKFKLLKIITTRGSERPWSIHMNGEITRFVRLKSPSKKSLSFSEIEIYPPLDAEKEKALLDLVHSEPITEELLKKISLINQAVEERNVNTTRALLEKEKDVSKEIKRILTFTALMKAVKVGDAGIARILINAGAKLSPGVTSIEPGKIIDILLDKKIKSGDDRELNVWNEYEDENELQKISPYLFRFSRIGIYTFEVIKDKEKNIIIVRKTKSKKNVKPRIQFGYEFNRKGLNKKIPGGKYIHFIVSAAISPNVIDKNNYLFISDYKEGWEAKKTYFSSSSWQTYLVSKKVRPACSRLILAFRFSPQSGEDRLKIRDVKIFVSEKPL